MKNVAIVPARCGSKSIPFKNIKRIAGRPLLYWSLSALEKCDQVDWVYLATDCPIIEKTVEGFGFEKVRVFKRSSASAADHSPTEDVLHEILDAQSEFGDSDLLTLVQATNPFIEAEDLEKAVGMVRSETADSVLSVCRIHRFFWSKEGESLNYDYRSRPRRQDFDGALVENGALYVTKIGAFRENNNRLYGRIRTLEMPPYSFYEIDEPDDWYLVEELMKRHKSVSLQDKRLKPRIRMLISDVDGVLTDSGMYYGEKGDEMKKFNTRDGMAFELMRKKGIKTALITSEETELVARRATKMKMDHLYQGRKGQGKLDAVIKLCEKEGLGLEEVGYVGDDINCREALEYVGWPACPRDAEEEIKNIAGIRVLESRGGEGVIREYFNTVLAAN